MSTSDYSLLTRLVAACVNISEKSANILRDIKSSGDLNIQEKGLNDYVTKADFQSQLNIIRSLENLFPKLKFCGEEGDLKDEYFDIETTLNEQVLELAKDIPEQYKSLKEEELIVWVDPLDATHEYTKGLDVAQECTVLIGISYNGDPIAGVINQPFFNTESKDFNNNSIGRVMWGIVGLGAYDSVLGNLKDYVKYQQVKDNHIKKIITTRTRLSNIIKKDFESIPNSKIINAAGAGYKSIAIIEGIADCYLFPKLGTKRWDICASDAILRSINAQLTDVFGNQYTYFDEDIDMIENCFGVMATLHKRNPMYIKYISDDLKNSLIKDAEMIYGKEVYKYLN